MLGEHDVPQIAAARLGKVEGTPETRPSHTERVGWLMDWGTVPAWVGSIGSVLAFSLATVIFARNSADKRREQARIVTPLLLPPQRLSATSTSLERVRNAIDGLPITHVAGAIYNVTGPVLVWGASIMNLSKEALIDIGAEIQDETGRSIVRMNRLGSLAPEKTAQFTLVSEPHDNLTAEWRPAEWCASPALIGASS